jgi:HEAT repeat protein
MRAGTFALTLALTATVLGANPQRAVRDLVADLSAADPVVRARAACGLKEQGDRSADAIEPLVRLLADASPVDPTVCRERWSRGDEQTTPGELAAAALVGIGSRTVPPLVSVLEQPQWIARRNAAWALGALDDPRGIAPVTAALRDREAGVRAQAAWALGAMDASAAVTGLIGALKDSDEHVREQAAWALGAIGDAAAVAALVDALRDTAKGVRKQAAWALGAIGDARATAGLVTALKDSEAEVRRQAAWALGVVAR